MINRTPLKFINSSTQIINSSYIFNLSRIFLKILILFFVCDTIISWLILILKNFTTERTKFEFLKT